MHRSIHGGHAVALERIVVIVVPDNTVPMSPKYRNHSSMRVIMANRFNSLYSIHFTIPFISPIPHCLRRVVVVGGKRVHHKLQTRIRVRLGQVPRQTQPQPTNLAPQICDVMERRANLTTTRPTSTRGVHSRPFAGQRWSMLPQ